MKENSDNRGFFAEGRFSNKAVGGIIQISKLIGFVSGLALLMFLIAFPMALLAKHLPTLFLIVSTAFIGCLVGFLLWRKYRNMEQQSLDNFTQQNGVGFKARFFYRVLAKPLVIIVVLLVYLIVLYTMTVSLAWGLLFLAVVSVLFFIGRNIIRSRFQS